jgi:oligoendopeptidase F
MSVLGQDYVDLLDRAYNEQWIDVYPRDTKRSGGYTWGPYGITNIVLLNWTDDLDSVFTLAHELGHALNHSIRDNHQEVQNSEGPLFMEEVASTFNENILFDYMYKNAKTQDEKFALLDYYTLNIIRTVFDQAAYSEFEDFCYKSIENEKSISKEIISKACYDIVNKPLEGVFDFTYSNPLWWQNFIHLYDSSYYVWQYALAYTISSEFSARVLSGGEKERKDYFEFLAGGHQEKPAELLKRLDIDINSEDFYKSSFKNFRNAIERFEEETKQYKK